MPLQRRNVHSVAKSGSTPLSGDVTLTGGTNVTLTQSGNDISIAAAGGGGTGATNLSATLSATNTIINSDTSNQSVNVFRNSIELRPGEQLTYPINLSGYRSIRSFATLAFPVKLIKSNFNLNGGVTFSRLPGSLNGVTNISKSTTYSAGAVIASNVTTRMLVLPS